MKTSTCIVAVKTKRDGIWLGGDSAGTTAYYAQFEMRMPKIFRNGPCLIGYTSSFRMGQLLQYKLTVPTRKKDQGRDHFMIQDFTEAVRTCLKDGGFAKVKDDHHEGGTFIVVYDGEIYKIQDDYSCLAHADPYAAVGCGDDFAYGALYTVKSLSRESVLLALRAARHASAGVGAPFYLANDQEPKALRKFDADGLEILSERRPI